MTGVQTCALPIYEASVMTMAMRAVIMKVMMVVKAMAAMIPVIVGLVVGSGESRL